MTPSDTLLPFGAQEEVQAPAEENHVNLCVFRVGQEEMVLDIMRIREILRPMAVTPVPRAPAGVRGLINVRGTVIPLVDLRVRFGLPPQEGPRSRVMVVLDHRRLYGLLVDAVVEVARVGRESLTSSTGILGGDASEVFAGVLQHKNRMLLLLNLTRLLMRDTTVVIPPMPAPGGAP